MPQSEVDSGFVRGGVRGVVIPASGVMKDKGREIKKKKSV